ncbi:hypothetical protein MM326_13960 [Alkalihalobacillus sp. LMS6]|uniref:hypothetical protein n=1 Tax=Alkalihalobacillus sp. LMS6 TaxID=2924034 RepID=UPI0020D03FED|nr:hypothetical protein [Alkalihalobacillus sp. LMS6]UTR05208.1 hypothetical protein MM326_13960 [Alkalihalobacillus sp. LMS6]
MEQYKKEVGQRVLTIFESRVSKKLFEDANVNERLARASLLVEENPFVTNPFRRYGILKQGESNIKILNAFQPNLWAQDFAFTEKKLDKMTVATAVERAEASAWYTLENYQNIRQVLKSAGVSQYQFIRAFIEAALIESAYYTRLSGAELTDAVKKRIDIALMKRAVRDKSTFKTVLTQLGVNDRDNEALFQFTTEMELTDVLREFIIVDPYYNRRAAHIDQFKEINSQRSVQLEHTKTPLFAEKLLGKLISKYPGAARKMLKAKDAS